MAPLKVGPEKEWSTGMRGARTRVHERHLAAANATQFPIPANGKPREVATQGQVADTRTVSRVNTYAVWSGAAASNS